MVICFPKIIFSPPKFQKKKILHKQNLKTLSKSWVPFNTSYDGFKNFNQSKLKSGEQAQRHTVAELWVLYITRSLASLLSQLLIFQLAVQHLSLFILEKGKWAQMLIYLQFHKTKERTISQIYVLTSKNPRDENIPTHSCLGVVRLTG